MRKDETEGQLGANCRENRQGNNVIDDFLKLTVLWAARGSRSSDAAIKNQSHQCINIFLEFKFKSADGRCDNDRFFREQMARHGRRSATIDRIGREANEYIEPGPRNYYERKKLVVAEEFAWASRNCPPGDSSSYYWKKFSALWRECSSRQSWQEEPFWNRSSPGRGGGERWESPSSSWSLR